MKPPYVVQSPRSLAALQAGGRVVGKLGRAKGLGVVVVSS